MTPRTLYEKGRFFLPGPDFCPECREPFFITVYKAAMMNKIIKEDIEKEQEQMARQNKKKSLLPARDDHVKVDWRDLPDAY